MYLGDKTKIGANAIAMIYGLKAQLISAQCKRSGTLGV